MSDKHGSMPLGKGVLRCCLKEWNVPDEWGTCRRLEEKDDLRTREGHKKMREIRWSIALKVGEVSLNLMHHTKSFSSHSKAQLSKHYNI